MTQNNVDLKLLRGILDPHGKKTFIGLLNGIEETITIENGLQLGQNYATTKYKTLTSTVTN